MTSSLVAMTVALLSCDLNKKLRAVALETVKIIPHNRLI